MSGELVNRTVEIWYDGSWHDITDDVRNTSPHQVTRGVSNRGGSADPGNLGLALNNGESNVVPGVAARYALRNPRSDLYGKIGPNTPIRLSAGLVGDTPTVRTVQEVVDWPPRWDVSGRDRWVPTSASGILRRLGIPSSPLGSPLRAAILPSDPVAYWPLEQGSLRDSALSGEPRMTGGVIAGNLTDQIPGSLPTPDLLEMTGSMSGAVGGSFTGSWWHVAFVVAYEGTDSWTAVEVEVSGGEFHRYSIVFTDTIELIGHNDDTGGSTSLEVVSGSVSEGLSDGPPRRIALSVRDVAGSVNYVMYIDDVTVSSATTGTDVGHPTRVRVRSRDSGDSATIGHVAVWSKEYYPLEPLPVILQPLPQDADVPDVEGFPGELAADRVDRLCLQAQVPLYVDLDVIDTFDRTVTDDWGDTDTDESWSTTGGDADDYAVSAGVGTIELDTLDSQRGVRTDDVAWPDVDMAATVSVSQVATGPGELDSIDVGVCLRDIDVDNRYVAQIVFLPGGTAAVGTLEIVDGTSVFSVLGNPAGHVPYEADTKIRVRGQVRGNVLRAKIWPASDPEPVRWGLEIETDDLVGSGGIGVRAILDSDLTNSLPITVSVSDLSARQLHPSPPMGVQPVSALLDLLSDCATVEAAGSRAPIVTEQRDQLGLRFQTLASLLLPRTPDLTLDYDEGQLSPPFDPTPDDFALVNDATARRPDGGSTRVEVFDGPKGITRAGRYDAARDFNAASDDQLPNIASWWTLHATWDEDRYPQISINMRSLSLRTDGAALVAAVQALDEGSLVKIENLPEEITEDVEQIVLGITETISTEEWTVALHTTPAGPFRVGLYADDAETPGPAEPKRYSPTDSRVQASFLTSTDTALSVEDQTGGSDLWSQTADFPYDIRVRGVRLRVTAVGAVNPSIDEGFEDATLNVTITDAGDAAWARSMTQANTGSWSLQAGSIVGDETSDAVVDVPADMAKLRFWYKVSSEEGFDFFRVLVDGVQVLEVSGDVDWTQKTVSVIGASMVTFRYVKDGTVDEGDDTAWIDDLMFESGVQVMTVDQAPVNGVTGVTIEAGEQVELWAPARYAM